MMDVIFMSRGNLKHWSKLRIQWLEKMHIITRLNILNGGQAQNLQCFQQILDAKVKTNSTGRWTETRAHYSKESWAVLWDLYEVMSFLSLTWAVMAILFSIALVVWYLWLLCLFLWKCSNCFHDILQITNDSKEHVSSVSACWLKENLI